MTVIMWLRAARKMCFCEFLRIKSVWYEDKNRQ